MTSFRHYKNHIKIIAIIFLLAIVSSLCSYLLTWAVEIHFGVVTKQGFFTGGDERRSAKSQVLPQDNTPGTDVPGCEVGVGADGTIKNDIQSIPSCVDTVDEFVNFMKSHNSSNWSWRRTGSAFIVNNILCTGSINCLGRIIDTASWDNLRNMLTNGDIDIQWHVPQGLTSAAELNTSYTGNGNDLNNIDDDVIWYKSSIKASEAITFSLNGAIVYKLRRVCANPYSVSDFSDKTSWSMATTTSVNPSTVLPGDSVTWTHTVKNNGPDSTDVDVNYYYQNTSGFGNSNKGGNGTLPSGSPQSISPITFSSTYTVSVGTPVGTQFCRKTDANPGGKDNAPTATSSACVTVSNPPPAVSNDCRPITIAVNLKTYGGYNSYAGAHSGNIFVPTVTIPVTVGSSLPQSWGTFSSNTTINATNTHTTGASYTVTFAETTRHITGYDDIYRTVYDYGWITDYKTVPCGTPGCTGSVTVPSGQHWGIVGSHQVYVRTDTNYAGPTSWTSTVGPCYDYALTARTLPLSNRSIEADSSVDVNPRITSNPYYGPTHTKSLNTRWEISQLIIQPNVAVPNLSNTNSNSSPCVYFQSKGSNSCSTVKSGNSIFDKNGGRVSGDDALSTYVASIGDYEAGTKICFAFSIQPRAAWDRAGFENKPGIDNQWNHSGIDPANNCVIIVKKPKVQIWGSNLLVNGFVQTNQSLKNGNIFGSWGEYGIISAGTISNMASGSAFAANVGLVNTGSACSYSYLSFTNVPAGGTICTGAADTIGKYTSTRPVIDIESNFPGGTTIAAGTAIMLNNLESGTYVVAGNLTLNTSTLSVGKSIIIKATGTVTINGDQIYTSGSYANVSQLPQLIIVANDIGISSSVTNIDAWLVAKGSINTCSSVVPGGLLTINICNQKLVVNGPVIVNKLYLHRTAGSGIGIASGDPAEVFNLRPDTYLWSIARASNNGRIQTVYSTELPPRF